MRHRKTHTCASNVIEIIPKKIILVFAFRLSITMQVSRKYLNYSCIPPRYHIATYMQPPLLRGLAELMTVTDPRDVADPRVRLFPMVRAFEYHV